ncbi:MAG: DUF2680 domain-containing protein [Patescibacteria group bacterium]|nr:DUF2680 domain-containing protein [Patescibacteria group bacterium]
MKKTLFISILAVISTVLISGFIMNAAAEESNGFMGLFGGDRDKMIENKAEVMGLSSEELQAKFDQGLNFHEIVEESGLSSEEMHEKMEAHKNAEIDNLVTEGKISEEYAQEIKQNMKERHQNRIENGGFGQGMKRGRGMMKQECHDQVNTDS